MGLVGDVEVWSLIFAPMQPIGLPASLVRRRPVFTIVAVIEDAAVHPRHLVMLPIDRGQRLPQLLIEHHAGKAPTCAHAAARAVLARGRCRYVTDSLSIGHGWGISLGACSIRPRARHVADYRKRAFKQFAATSANASVRDQRVVGSVV